jgi:hypothetical protein
MSIILNKTHISEDETFMGRHLMIMVAENKVEAL